MILQQGFYKMVLAAKVLAPGWIRPVRETGHCLQGRCQPWGRYLGPCIYTGHHVLTGILTAAHEISGFLTKLHLLSPPSLSLQEMVQGLSYMVLWLFPGSGAQVSEVSLPTWAHQHLSLMGFTVLDMSLSFLFEKRSHGIQANLKLAMYFKMISNSSRFCLQLLSAGMTDVCGSTWFHFVIKIGEINLASKAIGCLGIFLGY